MAVSTELARSLLARGQRRRARDVLTDLLSKCRVFEWAHTPWRAVLSLVAMEIERKTETPGIWLPLSALTGSSRGLWAAYVVVELPTEEHPDGATHQLIRRDLEVLHTDAERVFVRGTLEEGDWVVRDGLQRLVPGLRVRLASDTGVSAIELPVTARLDRVR